MSQEVKTYTLDEFWQLPQPADRSKLELIDGILYMTPPPEPEHDFIIKRLNRFLTGHLIATNNNGNIYVPRAALWTGANTYIEPDLFYLSAESEKKLAGNRRETADLVIEVISPGTEKNDREIKPKVYAALGVNELWLIDERTKSVEVFINAGNMFSESLIFREDDYLISKALPEFKIRVSKFFSNL